MDTALIIALCCFLGFMLVLLVLCGGLFFFFRTSHQQTFASFPTPLPTSLPTSLPPPVSALHPTPLPDFQQLRLIELLEKKHPRIIDNMLDVDFTYDDHGRLYNIRIPFGTVLTERLTNELLKHRLPLRPVSEFGGDKDS